MPASRRSGHDAASQMGECLDRLGAPTSRGGVDEYATGEKQARENRIVPEPT
jgi:hypothetical protein